MNFKCFIKHCEKHVYLINRSLSSITASLVKGRGTALAVEGFITQQQESPRHFVALSPLTRGAFYPDKL